MTKRDLTGDGSSDVIWWNRDGTLAYWDFDRGAFTYEVLANVPRSNFSLAGVGDITGDGSQDLLWRDYSISSNSRGIVYTGWSGFGYWDVDGGAITSWNGLNSQGYTFYFGSVQHIPAGTYMPRAPTAIIASDGADFLGDGRMSFMTSEPVTNNILTSPETIFSIKALASPTAAYTTYSITLNRSWYVADLGDLNGDRTTDILWRDRDSQTIGMHTVQNGISVAWTSFGNIGQEWRVLDCADFNGDGRDDILWRSDANAYGIWTMIPFGDGVLPVWQSIGQFASFWQVKATGDYFGDGSADLMWRNTQNGEVQLWDYDNGGLTGATNLDIVPINWDIVSWDVL